MDLNLSPRKLRELSELKFGMGVFQLCIEWGLIFSAVLLAVHVDHLAWDILTVFWIGSRQHALAILMHEGVHYRLAKSRKLNNFLSEVFAAWPVFVTMRSYRVDHLLHHEHTHTDRDPDLIRKKKYEEEWKFPKSRLGLTQILLQDLFVLKAHYTLLDLKDLHTSGRSSNPPSYLFRVGRIAFYLGIFASILYFSVFKLFLFFWVLPFFTWFRVLLRARSISEHFGFKESVKTSTRTVIPAFWERLVLAPRNISYHIEHHLYPSVPFYRLPELHKVLRKQDAYAVQGEVIHTYWGVFKHVTQKATS